LPVKVLSDSILRSSVVRYRDVPRAGLTEGEREELLEGGGIRGSGIKEQEDKMRVSIVITVTP
jgi:hypothetical protein